MPGSGAHRCLMPKAAAGVLQVVAILEQTRSSYLATFLSLRKAIQQEAVVAEDNLKFLQCLEQPCRTLASATAKVGTSHTSKYSHGLATACLPSDVVK